MGLAPYGAPKYKTNLDNLIDIKEDGSFFLNQSFFNYATGLTMTNQKFSNLFNKPVRKFKRSFNTVSYGCCFFNTICDRGGSP